MAGFCISWTRWAAAAEPRNNWGVAFGDVVKAKAGGRDKDQVGVANIFDGSGGMDGDGAVAADGAPRDGSGVYAEARGGAFASADIEEGAGVAKDFHGADGGGGEGAVEEEDGDVD